jgi:acyl-CoA reductase-like NAD-dependent aldehyde dehydrogenase
MKLKNEYPLYLANRPTTSGTYLDVLDKFSGESATRVSEASEEMIDRAIAQAVAATKPMRELPAFRRRDILSHCVKRFQERAEELAFVLCVEAGKPIKDSRGEVSRLIDTFRIAAEESVRITGEVLPLEISARTTGYLGQWKRVPVGPCSFVTPFNFPLNLVAHKVAPAIAAGCPFVLKPASLTPVGALIIGEVLAETDLPAGAFSILPCKRDAARLFTEDERLRLLSFTGSALVGWELKAKAGKKKVVMELGGNAACIIDKDADLADVTEKIKFGAFYQSGQSCISVQRILVHASRYDEFRDRFVTVAKALQCGDPKSEETFIGPLISDVEAKRVEDWVQSAVGKGGRLLCGGHRTGRMMDATILENVPHSEKIWAEEAFGPVAVLDKFDVFEEALATINDSRYGLQAGIFTNDLRKAMQAWDELEVGGVIIGEVPSWRVDHMPYGGVKDSGLGREGIRFAIEDMTEIRLLVLNLKVKK